MSKTFFVMNLYLWLPLAVLLLANGITHWTQLSLYEQQRHQLHSGRGTSEGFAAAKSSAQVSMCRSSHEATDAPVSEPLLAETAPLHQKKHRVLPSYVSISMCYMDEIFHVPQILRYGVLGNTTYYDPMITTPAGSYLLPAATLHALLKPRYAAVPLHQETPPAASFTTEDAHVAYVWHDGCRASLAGDFASCGAARVLLDSVLLSVAPEVHSYLVSLLPQSVAELVHLLRWENSALHLVVWAIIVLRSAGQRHGHSPTKRVATANALAAALCPPLLFSSVLVYTDVASAAVTAVMVLAMPSGLVQPSTATVSRICFVASAGLFAVFVRQTNIVWLFFVAVRFFMETVISAWSLRKSRSLLKSACRSIVLLLPCAVVASLFVGFVYVNGGIVLGDKSSHEAVFHPAQLVYLCATIAAFFPFHALRWVRDVSTTRGWGSMAVILLSASVAYGSLTHFVWFHPYLVADNRHYTNVLYRKVLANSLTRLAVMVPASVVGFGVLCQLVVGRCVLTHGGTEQFVAAAGKLVDPAAKARATQAVTTAAHIVSRCRLAECLLLLFCAAISCVPQKLIELRYFVPVIVVACLVRCKRPSLPGEVLAPREVSFLSAEALSIAYLLSIHAVTCYVFVNRTFTAPDGSTGRFMW